MDAGFRSAHALPMHLQQLTIGALNLFRADEGELTRDDVVAAQALADMATIAILLNRVAVRAPSVNSQLDRALNDRVRIEQAKGVVAEQTGVDLDQAFEWLRTESATQDRLLSDVAQSVIDRTTRATPGET